MEDQEKPQIEKELLQSSTIQNFEQQERPQFLTVLCILSFIGSGLGILFSTLFILAYDWILSLLENNPMASEFNLTKSDIAIGLLLTILSLVGALMMFKSKKIGFFIYAGANAIAAFLPEYSTFTLIFNAIWIGMYAANFKSLK
jgi:hypothetical protein